MWLGREISEQIKDVTKVRPCVVLTGARQTGKSSLLMRLFPDYEYVSLDLPSLAAEAKENGTYFLEKRSLPLIIDEIQYVPELLRFLKIAIDKKRATYGQYLLTGSQKFSLMKGVSESLAGRLAVLECHSLSIRELAKHFHKTLTPTLVAEWLVKGGYPELHANNLQPARFFADYVATYLERDVRQLLNVKDLAQFDKFLRLLALRSGQVLNMNTLASDVGMSAPTIKQWLSVLEASNVIFLLKPFYKNFGKRLVKSPKLYFLDTGLLCFLTGIFSPQSLLESSLLGSFFETLALGQLVRSYNNRGLPAQIYYFRDSRGTEIDFMVAEGNKLTLYESKWQLQSGDVPKNIRKFTKIVGEKTIKNVHIITGGHESIKIAKNTFITNLVNL